jgi:predicted unusual protein kinase regulating ubiquinone biosynthesis (AarF/ABC1/UbiB family)
LLVFTFCSTLTRGSSRFEVVCRNIPSARASRLQQTMWWCTCGAFVAFLTPKHHFTGFLHADAHGGNLFKVTEGPNAGQLALLDFGLVAEIPTPDREAMVSATIHLANKDWDALIDDFVALGFLPTKADRALIIPVMDRVLSPYLRGGGAAAFNFQALSQVCCVNAFVLR